MLSRGQNSLVAKPQIGKDVTKTVWKNKTFFL